MNTYVGNPEYIWGQIELSVIDPCPTQNVSPTGPETIELPPGGVGETAVFMTFGEALALFSLSETTNTECQITAFSFYKDGQPLTDATLLNVLSSTSNDFKIDVEIPAEYTIQLGSSVQGFITVSNDITIKIACTPAAVSSLTLDLASSPASPFFTGADGIIMALTAATSGTTVLQIRDSFEAEATAPACSDVTFYVSKDPLPDFNVLTSCPGSECQSATDDLTRCIDPNNKLAMQCCGGEWGTTTFPWRPCGEFNYQ
jgi:hypothetical protein